MSSTSHRRKERLYPLTFFRKWREHFVFSRGLELLGNRFLKNLHITEEDEYVKEHSLVKIPKYHWNAKEVKVLNFRPDTLDLAIQEGESEKFFFLKIETYLREKYTAFLVLLGAYCVYCFNYGHSWKVSPAVQD